MKAILLTLGILACGGAAYFSYDQGAKLNGTIAARNAATEEQGSVEAKNAKVDKEIAALNEKIATATAQKETITQSVSALKSSGSALKRELATLKTEGQAQEEELAGMQKTIDELKGLVTSLGADITIDNLPSKIQEMQDAKKAKEAKLEELKTLAEGAAKAAAESRAEQDRLAKRKLDHAVAIRRNSTESVITAVNADWGFVVVGAGSNSGFKPKAPLLVERDGVYIGKIIPSSVEPTQTIAEIDTASLSTGVRLQPGDRVIVAQPAN